VAFVDWQMPGIDGWETSLRLRHQGVGNDKALVMMVTAHGREMLADRSPIEQAELGGFLVKPVTASMLFDAVVNARLGRGDGSVRQVKRAPERRLEGMRLLVVEDNPNNQQVAQELLEAEGAVVQLADNGQAGVDAVREADPPFDAVLMDLQMPVMDGFTAARLLRAQPASSSLPLIAMTANAMSADREACLASGMTDHIGKPFELTDLVHCLLRHTGRQEAADSLAGSGAALGDVRLSPQALRLAGEGGVDVLTAVGRLGGQVGVYERMLRGFLCDLPDLLMRLEGAVRAASWAEAAVEMHTLKGLAGTLGLSSLQADSAEAERVLQRGISAREAEQHVARVLAHVQRLQAVGTALATALQSCVEGRDAVAAPPLTAEELQGHLHLLEALLRRSDMGALTLLEQLRAPLTQALAEHFADLDHAVQALDFDRAAQICNALASRDPSSGRVGS
jgi:CheY-like chemotaxis protein